MTTIKSYTDLEQSRKLANILPIESADMHYATWTILDGEFIVSPNQGSTIEDLQEDYGTQIIPCWSLAALINAMPKIQGDKAIIYLSDNDHYVSYTHIGINAQASSLVDACYEIIIKLNEQNLL